MANPDETPSTAAPRKAARRKRTEPAAKRPGRLAAGLALVFATIALLGTAYMGYLINSKRGLSDAKGRLVQVERDTAELEQLTTRMGAELATLRDTQATLTDGLQALHGELGKGRRAWLIAEAENLLIIAQHRLSYARDARLAREALRAADRQLAQLGDPDYQPVRKQIETELAALEAFEKLDPAGQALRLGQLAARVDQLPLRPESRPSTRPAPAEQDFLHELWSDLKGLVRIRSTTDVSRPFLLPEHKYYLRENLRLLLLSAQVALLSGHGASFEQNARLAQQWLRSYFLESEPGVQAALADLDKALRVRTETLPDLGGSLKTLHEARARQSAS
jgi:uroporphyrin-3 C-methyltransferase